MGSIRLFKACHPGHSLRLPFVLLSSSHKCFAHLINRQAGRFRLLSIGPPDRRFTVSRFAALSQSRCQAPQRSENRCKRRFHSSFREMEAPFHHPTRELVWDIAFLSIIPFFVLGNFFTTLDEPGNHQKWVQSFGVVPRIGTELLWVFLRPGD